MRHCGAALLVVMAVVVAACAQRPLAPPVGKPAAVRTIADEFILTFWCAPPLDQLTDSRAREIAEAGFNVVGSTCEGPINPGMTRRALDTIAPYGLRMWVKDHRLSAYHPLDSGWQEPASEAIAFYREHPALAGFFLLDEPTEPQFDDLAALNRRIRREAPSKIGYVNMLPDYAVEEADPAADYRDFLEDFASRVRPRLLSYDHYPFRNDRPDRPSFFRNLEVVRAVALDYEIPFMLIVLAMPHASYRDPNEAELAWQAFNAIAFGARGISYFAYWTPVGVRDNVDMHFRHGIIEGGRRTIHYDQVKRLNPQLRALAEILEPFRSIAVHDTRGDFGGPLPQGPLEAVDGAPFTVGVFGTENGSTAALLVNRSYKATANAELRLANGAPPPRVFDPVEKAWSEPGGQLFVPPGGALLLIWGVD